MYKIVRPRYDTGLLFPVEIEKQGPIASGHRSNIFITGSI